MHLSVSGWDALQMGILRKLVLIAMSTSVAQVSYLTNSYLLHFGDLTVSELNLILSLFIDRPFQIF